MGGEGRKPALSVYSISPPGTFYHNQLFLILYQYSWPRSLNSLWDTDHPFPHCCITGVQNSGTVCVNMKAMCAWPHGKASFWPRTPTLEGTPWPILTSPHQLFVLCVSAYVIPQLSSKEPYKSSFYKRPWGFFTFMIFGKMHDINFFKILYF